MAILTDLEPLVCNRLEEPPSPVFWDLVHELRPMLVEAQNEAALITGQPEIIITPGVTLAINNNVQPMPANLIAITRIESADGFVQKTTVKDLDHLSHKWQNDFGVDIDFWFPIGLNSFGIHPQLSSPIDVVVFGIALPVPVARPYTGAETVPFQLEYDEGLVRYASSVLRLKEGGPDFMQGLQDYEYFLKKMGELTAFADRTHSFRFSRAVGSQAEVTRREKQ